MRVWLLASVDLISLFIIGESLNSDYQIRIYPRGLGGSGNKMHENQLPPPSVLAIQKSQAQSH